MDTFNEKKWFVYLGDHHEGPFSLSDIKSKMDQGQVSTASYVWAEGLSDWRVMTDVPDFGSLLGSSILSSPPPGLDLPSHTDVALQHRETTHTGLSPGPALNGAVAAPQPAPQSAPTAPHADPQTTEDAEPSPARPRKKMKIFFGSLLLLIVGGIALLQFEPVSSNPAVSATSKALVDAFQPILDLSVGQFPFLSAWISPLPRLEDVAKDDYQELRSAASARLDKDGPRIAVVLSASDPLAPTFYVASNLPDGMTIQIFVEGIPDTLLNQTSFTGVVKATLSKHLGKSEILRFPDEKPVPRGQYEVFATEGEPQPPEAKNLLAGLQPLTAKVPAVLPKGFKLLATKSYFLGGAKDSAYTARLKEFHDRLRDKATAELGELKQFSLLLENQVKATNEKFHALSTGKATPNRKKPWADYHKTWTDFAAQMGPSLAKWTPEAIQKDFFYGTIYPLVIQTYKSVEELHTLQNSFFANKVERSTFDIQLGQVAAVAGSSVAGLKAKIEQAEKIPPSPNGMPRREGL